MFTLTDQFLSMAAEAVDDLERVRKATASRIGHLTRSTADKDGEVRGLGVPPDHPDVQRMEVMLEGLRVQEAAAVKFLEQVMRRHPLGPWIDSQHGIGNKQGARLLAAIGDPYMRPDIQRENGMVELARPRTVSELWAYCGMHVVDIDSDGAVKVAPARRRGQYANWNATARMRIYLIAKQIVRMDKGTRWRDFYDESKAKYYGTVHKTPCAQCGGEGPPQPVGSPLRPGHQDSRAVRLVAKEILKELWREAGRLHGHDTSPPPPEECAA